MAQSGRTATLHRVMEEGYTDSYGALLYLTAVMGSDADALAPASAGEENEWRGHLKGLRAALLCLAMHERRAEPEEVALVVGRHIEDAMDGLKYRDSASSGGVR